MAENQDSGTGFFSKISIELLFFWYRLIANEEGGVHQDSSAASRPPGGQSCPPTRGGRVGPCLGGSGTWEGPQS